MKHEHISDTTDTNNKELEYSCFIAHNQTLLTDLDLEFSRRKAFLVFAD